MQHSAAFYQGLHCLLKLKQPSGTEIHHNVETSTCDPFIQNWQSHAYCINIEGKIHQYTNRVNLKAIEMLTLTLCLIIHLLLNRPMLARHCSRPLPNRYACKNIIYWHGVGHIGNVTKTIWTHQDFVPSPKRISVQNLSWVRDDGWNLGRCLVRQTTESLIYYNLFKTIYFESFKICKVHDWL